MGKQYQSINEKLKTFIQTQKIFFVATAAKAGRVNLSPKGMDTFRILNDTQVVWLNLTGSGNETAAHIAAFDRMTIMFCAFEENPVILRLFGHAKAIHPRDPEWKDLILLFPDIPGARQIIRVEIDLALTSCGMGVPYYAYQGEREELKDWAEEIGNNGIRQYWEDHNQLSLDGRPTHIFDT